MTQDRKPTILWVDSTFYDKLHHVMAYEDELSSGGFAICKIPHPDEALDILEKNEKKFACIILEIRLPYGTRFTRAETEEGYRTGIILGRKIRQYDEYKDVPIVMLTAYPWIFEIIKECKKEFKCFIKADISPEKFLDEITKLVGGRG